MTQSSRTVCRTVKLENRKYSRQHNSENSSNNTVIEAEKTEKSPEIQKFPDNAVSCPPIPGGHVYNIVHPPGMEGASKLISSTGTEESATPPQTLSREQKYKKDHKSFTKKTAHVRTAT